jgi:hypothetical protein
MSGSQRPVGRLAVLAIAAIVTAGCGGSDRQDPAPTAVVRAWSDALRHGDVAGAARYFAVPSLVANGAPPQELTTAAEVLDFNAGLPCGAKLVATERGPRGFTIATFVLTERPGPGVCAAGVGHTARTAFRVRGGKITDWLRVQDIPAAPATQV